MLGLPLLLAPRRVVMRFGRFWARSVLALLRATVGLDGEIRGLGNLPPGPCIVAMKHQSAWDTLILPVVLGDPGGRAEARAAVGAVLWLVRGARRIDRDRPRRPRGGAAPHAGGGPAGGGRGPAGRDFPGGHAHRAGPAVPYQPGVAALYQTLACRWCRRRSIPGCSGAAAAS